MVNSSKSEQQLFVIAVVLADAALLILGCTAAVETLFVIGYLPANEINYLTLTTCTLRKYPKLFIIIIMVLNIIIMIVMMISPAMTHFCLDTFTGKISVASFSTSGSILDWVSSVAIVVGSSEVLSIYKVILNRVYPI